ncbi:MAG: DUF2683 family protein [Candidatus Pacearchaeota archaeon]
MVKATVDIPEEENRVLNIVKGKYGFKNKEEALIFILNRFMENLEPELRPEYIDKLKKIEKERGIPFKNIDELRKIIEG